MELSVTRRTDPALVIEPDAVGVRVRVHPGVCEGWGLCHRFGGEVYPLDAEGYVDIHLLEVPAELADAARLGASVCPAQAISILVAGSPGPVDRPAGQPVDRPTDRPT